MTTELRDYAGAAVPTTLAGPITDADTAITIANATGWKTGSGGTFFIVVDPGLSTEEHIKIVTRSGTALTVATSGRGADNTTAVAHALGAVVQAVFTADDATLLNQHAANEALDDHTQYVHNTNARTVSADHDFTGNPTFSGTPNFSGDPTFVGTPHFTGTPTFDHMGETADLVSISGETANGGTSAKPMRADAQLAITDKLLNDIRWFSGEIKFSISNGAAPSGGVELLGQTGLSKVTYAGTWADYQGIAAVEIDATTFRLIDGRGLNPVGAGSGGSHNVGDVFGADTATLTTTELPTHNHSFAGSAHTHTTSETAHHHGGSGGIQFVNGSVAHSTIYSNAGSDSDHSPAYNLSATPNTADASTGLSVNAATATGTIGNNGSGSAFSIVQRSIGVRMFVRLY